MPGERRRHFDLRQGRTRCSSNEEDQKSANKHRSSKETEEPTHKATSFTQLGFGGNTHSIRRRAIKDASPGEDNERSSRSERGRGREKRECTRGESAERSGDIAARTR